MRKELQAELPCHRYSLPTLSIEKEDKTMTDYPNNIPAKLEIIKASEITPKEVRWLWYPYIPFGKVTLLQGDPGDGKSKLMLSLAALLSKGAPLPFADEDESGEPMTVIYQTTEDDADDTVVPRFNAAGGDGDRLIFIKEDEKSLTFGDDRIREAVEKYNAKLLILDPMSSYIGDTCSMNNANETRAEFNHLIAVAKDTGCAIVIIAHMNKAKDTSPLYRTNGSIDIAGAARSILAVTRTANKQNPAERYLVQVKSNLAPMGSAILFEVADKGVNFIAFGPAVELSYLAPQEQRELLETIESEDATPSISQAQRMRKMSEEGYLYMDQIFEIMTEVKGNQVETIKVPTELVQKHFKKFISPKEMQDFIAKAVEHYCQYLINRERTKNDAR